MTRPVPRLLLVFCALIAMCVSVPETAPAQTEDERRTAQHFFEAGQVAMDAGDRLRAVAAWRLAVRHDPNHLQGWIALGDALLESDPAFAATAYRRAVSLLLEAAPSAQDTEAQAPTGDEHDASAQAEPVARPLHDGAELDGVLEAAARHLQAELGRPVFLSPVVARRYGAHAFVMVSMRRPDGRPLDWENTPYADLWAADMMSDLSMTLLEETAQSWRVIEHETGPTDVAWFAWMHARGLPQALFVEEER